MLCSWLSVVIYSNLLFNVLCFLRWSFLVIMLFRCCSISLIASRLSILYHWEIDVLVFVDLVAPGLYPQLRPPHLPFPSFFSLQFWNLASTSGVICRFMELAAMTKASDGTCG